MSAAPAITADAAPTARGGRKKLLIIIIAAALLVLLGGGAAAFFVWKKPVVQEDDGSDEGQVAAHTPVVKAKRDAGHPPIFVPLDPFTVNLADRDSERYAQIGITLEIDDAKTAEVLKAYMPAIRNNILMVLSQRTADQMLTREGKEQLSTAILRAAVRPLGYEFDDEAPAAATADDPSKKKRRKKPAPALPVTAVHFSNFIIQ